MLVVHGQCTHLKQRLVHGALSTRKVGNGCARSWVSTPNTRDRLTHAVQDAAVHCSHMIFLCRFHKVWETRPLLDTYGWYGAAEVSE